MIDIGGPDGTGKMPSHLDWVLPAVLGAVVFAIPICLFISSISKINRRNKEAVMRNRLMSDGGDLKSLFEKRGTEVFYFSDRGHDCYMATAGNAVGLHCPK